MFHSTEDSWNPMLSMMKQAPGGKLRLESNSSDFDPFTLPSPKALVHSPLGVIATLMQVGVQNPFPR